MLLWTRWMFPLNWIIRKKVWNFRKTITRLFIWIRRAKFWQPGWKFYAQSPIVFLSKPEFFLSNSVKRLNLLIFSENNIFPKHLFWAWRMHIWKPCCIIFGQNRNDLGSKSNFFFFKTFFFPNRYSGPKKAALTILPKPLLFIFRKKIHISRGKVFLNRNILHLPTWIAVLTTLLKLFSQTRSIFCQKSQFSRWMSKCFSLRYVKGLRRF